MEFIELLTPTEMSEADRLTISGGTTGFALMERAGIAVAEAAARMAGEQDVLLVAGPGNNGGDGLVAAAMLRRMGRSARVALLGEPEKLADDAARAYAAYDGPVERLGPGTDLSAGLVVDALFGAGLTRDLDDAAAAAVDALNAGGRPVLAVDLP